MKERLTTVKDEGIVYYSVVFRNALKLEKDIKRNIQEGEKTVYRTICEEATSHSIRLEIGDDLLRIAQGAAFAAYCELAYVTIFVKKTGEEIRVINPVGKAIADGIISEVSTQKTPTEGVSKVN